jgi:hypothetical protein
MFDEKEIAIRPIVQESVQHNARVSEQAPTLVAVPCICSNKPPVALLEIAVALSESKS